MSARAPLDPYRLLFPLGVVYAVLGAALWPLHVAGLLPYPAAAHWTLMVQGFQHCFILGFLLTAMPSFLHAERCRPAELAAAFGAMVLFGFAAVWGAILPAQLFYAATLIVVIVMAARRLGRGAAPPPEEFLLVGFGLLLGLAGAAMIAAGVLDPAAEPAPRFGLRSLWMGMILSIVLGVGGLLVPTFAAMRGPLEIPGIARPHERAPRRVLYAAVALAMAASLALEAAGRGTAGALLRAVTATLVLALVWKLHRRPGRRDLLSYVLWGSGWMIGTGLWLMVLVPLRPLLGAHVVLLGGFGALTAGIATRVVVRHGNHPLAEEPRVLRPAVALLLAATLAARVMSELSAEGRNGFLAASALAWIAAWSVWIAGAAPRLLRVRRPAPGPGAAVAMSAPGVRGAVAPARSAPVPPANAPAAVPPASPAGPPQP